MEQSRTPPAWATWALDHPGCSRLVPVDGINLHTLCWSDADLHKPALLFVHGHRAHAHWWDFIAPFFAERFRVFAMDLSGMGDSGHRQHYQHAVGGHDIVGLVQGLGLESVTVVGHSNGGLRALNACAQAPQLFSRLIAIDTYAVFNGGDHPADPPRLRGDRVYADEASAIARYRLLPDQPISELWAFDHVARFSVRSTEGGWRWKFDSSMPSGITHEDDADALLAAVTCPVHYIYGGESRIVSKALAERIVNGLPNGHGPIAIPGGHHHLMFDQPVALISTLQALLA